MVLDSLVEYMPVVNSYRSELESLNKQLSKITLTGKISCLDVAETLFDFMEETQGRFASLQHRLIEKLTEENVSKTSLLCSSRAQVIIDILIRNLFERTADVGFLATDDDIREFLKNGDADKEALLAIEERLHEYVKKYSVYDEVIILKPNGVVAAHLNKSNKITSSNDPIIQKTIHSNADFCELFRHSDLQPKNQYSLIYTAKITALPAGKGEVIGVLCLCFKIQDEMKGIFKTLEAKNMNFALLEEGGRLLIANNDQTSNQKLSKDKLDSYRIVKEKSGEVLSSAAISKGYQGYKGMGWIGYCSLPLRYAFTSEANKIALNEDDFEQAKLISKALQEIRLQADDITEGLVDVVINGEIIASKRRAYALNPILDSIREISERIHGIITKSIEDIYSTVIASHLSDLSFRAALAVEIMDRNLYERANDCRWWALTTSFSEIMSDPNRKDGKKEMEGILAYINGLYTVYTNLFLYDRDGIIIAVSNPSESNIVGSALTSEVYKKSLANSDTQKYFVTKFEPSDFYGGDFTYIYCASIKNSEDASKTIGGIGIVFDSAPQFQAMLEDVLPSNDSTALFCDTQGRILSKIGAIDKKIGEIFEPAEKLGTLHNGQSTSMLIEYEQSKYLLGAAMSNGYREYKKSDGYKNNILCIILTPL